MAISLPRINPAPLESGGDSLKVAADKINSAMLAIEQQALQAPGSFSGQGGKALVVSPNESGLVFRQVLLAPGSFSGQGGKALVVSPDESGLVFAALGGKKFYTTPGTYTFTVPPGVTTVYVTMCGGGGGGGGGSINYSGGHGGGAGTYFKKPVTVTPGATYTITVGAGGAGGVYSSERLGRAGGTSSFGNLLSATGGGGGGGATRDYSGSTGAPGTAPGPGGMFGKSTDSFLGWFGATPTARNGTGYGSGGHGGPVGGDGGIGAPGFVLIEW